VPCSRVGKFCLGEKGLGGAFGGRGFGERTKPLVWDIFAVGPEAG